MTLIHELIAAGPTVSFEFSPPKTEEASRQLKATLDELALADPAFVSVTYGAGGSTRSNTREAVIDICASRAFPAMAHLTCVSHGRDEMIELLEDYRDHGVHNILALAGDPPADGSPARGDFNFAWELVALCREFGNFSVGVAAFPEVHPRSASRADDRRRLAEKLEMADFAITQFFFDADDYLRLVDELADLGVTKPVLPGIIPVTSPATIRRFAVINGTRVPEDRFAVLEGLEGADRLALAVEHAVELSATLLDRGVPGLHFYTLNHSAATLRILGALGLLP